MAGNVSKLSGHDQINLRGAAEAVLVVARLELAPIEATSPSMAETMRLCELRANLSKIDGITSFMLGSPKAWLGTVYHEVLEKIVRFDFGPEDFEKAFNSAWNEAVAVQHRRCQNHPLNGRFGPPETWPGYHLARASALERAREIVAAVPNRLIGRRQHASHDVIREEKFTAFKERLVGRPDVIRPPEIIDYKSGALSEFDESAQGDVVKAAYVRQLRIYGFLVNENLGWWPQRGVLLPLGGTGTEIALSPDDCIREATEAVELLDRHNAALRSGRTSNELATPSPRSCKWCPFKLLCSIFWKVSSPSWSGTLDGAAVEGVLRNAPRAIHAGAAFTIELQIESGTETLGKQQIGPFNASVHPILASLSAGDRIRIVGLRTRSDNTLLTTQRTVLARVADVPEIVNTIEKNN